LGRTVRATANHKFRAFEGWKRLDELEVGQRLALPRIIKAPVTSSLSPAEAALLGHLIGDGCTLPRHAIQYTTNEMALAEEVVRLSGEVFGSRVTPKIKKERNWIQVYLAAASHLTHGVRNPVAEWLETLNCFGLRSWEKRVPDEVFTSSEETVAAFLRHLWATDGCIHLAANGAPSIYYASSSEGLVCNVQSLLLRLGINAVVREYSQGEKGRNQHHAMVMGRSDMLAFAAHIGATPGRKREALEAVTQVLAGRDENTNRDVIPNAVWRSIIVPLMQQRSLTTRQFQAGIGMAYMGTSLYKQNVSRERMGRVARALDNPEEIVALAHGDVYWDEILSIEPDGEDDVYDLTVPGYANFVANDIIVHNSIEQDADVVMFIYREDMQKENSERKNIADVIVAKHRNGPTDTISLYFHKELTKFSDLEFVREPLES
jgi:replicative DNA helicase